MRKINALKLDNIINALVAREGWRLKDAQEVAGQYRNWLYLATQHPDKHFPPSEDVDEFWHMHVLHTAQYRADCDEIFGAYFDHEPTLSLSSPPFKKGGPGGISDLGAAFQELQALHKEEFGDYIYEVRGRFQKLVSMLKKTIKG